MGSVEPPPTLDYIRVLHAGGFRFRSWVGAGIWLAMAALAGMFIALVSGRLGPPPAGWAYWAFAGGAAVATAGLAAVSLAIVTGRVDRFELTTAGVQHGRRVVPWSHVTRVVAGGTPSGPTVRLYYTRRTTSGGAATAELPSVPSLPVAGYRALTDRLRAEVLPAHPHLRLGEYEPVRTLDPS